MKKIILTLIALMVLGSLLVAQDVAFEKKNRDEASNIQGTIYHLVNGEWVRFEDCQSQVKVTLINNEADNESGYQNQSAYLTPVWGDYSHNFDNPDPTHYDTVKVEFEGHSYESPFDGIVRIDIYWDGSVGPDDGTDPNDD